VSKLIVLTGLDGSGTSFVADHLHKVDPGSHIYKNPPPVFASGRDQIDQTVRQASPVAHYYFYLAANVYASEEISLLLESGNVYCVRYLIDTVVHHRASGVPVELEYETPLYRLRKPDVTIFLKVDERIRQNRLRVRGRSFLDHTLDEDAFRTRFLNEFDRLANCFITVDNSQRSIQEVVQEIRSYL
jgi:thymidylate kinase